MSKILIQKTVTVTLELTGAEANSLFELLALGVTDKTLETLKLGNLYQALADNLDDPNGVYEYQAEKVSTAKIK